MSYLHEDRLFSSDKEQKSIAKEIYNEIKDLPIISPHGHTDPTWYADNINFPDPASLFIKPDHYVHRMMYSQGITLEELGVPFADGSAKEHDNRKIWDIFANNYYLYAGTPSQMWLDTVFSEVFGFDQRLSGNNASAYYDKIDAALKTDEYKIHHLLDRFNIKFIATTEDPLDPLKAHQKINTLNLKTKIVTTFRPDNVTNPEFPNFLTHIQKLGEITGEDTLSYKGYIKALQNRRAYFKEVGNATASDHGFPSAFTIDLTPAEAEALYNRIINNDNVTAKDCEVFRGHMLMKMAEMSLDDGLVMQLHPGAYRNHNDAIFNNFGADKGADIPMNCEFTHALKPILNKFGNDPRFRLIMFTLDEDNYSRELAPLAGHYPALTLGPAWWFFDSPEGMLRYRQYVTETAGFYNTAGFNDDTRAFLSIPARHDVARRIDARFLATLVAEKRLGIEQAHILAKQLTNDLAKKAYRINI
ncbi:MAG: glucuronate isomerase [Alphaproteobacteria bacterium]